MVWLSPQVTAEQSGVIPESKTGETFKIVSPLEINEGTAKLRAVLAQAYLNIGITIEIKNLPAQRALHEAQYKEWVDAELGRAEMVHDELSNFIAIPVPLAFVRIYCLSLKGVPLIRDWQDLSQYRVAHIRGLPYHEAKLNEVEPIEQRAVTRGQQALELLESGRVDVAVIPAPMLNELLTQGQQKHLNVTSIDGNNLYHYVHKKHKLLVPQITEQFRLVFPLDSIAD